MMFSDQKILVLPVKEIHYSFLKSIIPNRLSFLLQVFILEKTSSPKKVILYN